MNEITRIHLAKVAYDIEIDAKKELEAYEKGLRNHLEDIDTLDDIEVRMSELLADHGVSQGGVISLEDVTMIREQLGEPSEFGDKKVTTEEDGEKPVKKLYRDLDNAMVGGVMSGIAAYFRLDPTLVRILGLLLVAISFGAFIFAYVLLWLLIPAAKTASQRLEMTGKPLTLENINITGEAKLSHMAKTMRRAMFIIAGIGAIGTAVGAVIAVWHIAVQNSFSMYQNVGFWNGPGLFVSIAGIAFAMFMLVVGYGLIRQTWRRQLTFALFCLTLIGVTTFGVGVYGYFAQRYNLPETFSTSTQTAQKYSVPDMSGVTKLVIDSSVPVYYGVGKASLSVTATKALEPILTVSGNTATLRYDHVGDASIWLSGPVLSSVEVTRGTFDYYLANGGALSVVLNPFASATVRGILQSLSVTTKGNGAVLDAQQLAVDSVKIIKTSDSSGESAVAQVLLATVGSLDITYPVACTALAGLSVSTYSVAGSLTANGQAVTLPSESGCFKLTHSRQQ